MDLSHAERSILEKLHHRPASDASGVRVMNDAVTLASELLLDRDELLEALRVLLAEVEQPTPGFHQMPCVLNAKALLAKARP